MKDQDENKESSYLKCWGVNNLYGQALAQKSSSGDFKYVKNTSQFSKDSIKNYNADSDQGHFLKDDIQYPEKLHNLHNGLPFSS